MKTIWKYELESLGFQTISMPTGAEILHVANQNDVVCLWCEVDRYAEPGPRDFIIFGTGHPIEDREKLLFIGSVLLYDGTLVLHIYEQVHFDAPQ